MASTSASGASGEGAAALTEFGRLGEFLLDLADSPGDRLPLLVTRGEQRLDFRLLFRQRVEFGADLEFFELAQRSQPHVEDRFGLDIGEPEALDHHGLRLILSRMMRMTSSMLR